MSIFFDFDVGSTGRRFRRAVHDDKSDIELFMNEQDAKKIFGVVDIGSLIELSVLPICMIDENKRVVGFLALSDYPNIPGVDPAKWETWIRNMFQKFYLSRNTLFVHYACCNKSVMDYFLEEGFVSVFKNDPYLTQIVLITLTGVEHDFILLNKLIKKRNLLKIPPRRDDDTDVKYRYMYAALRNDYFPRIKIRRAVEEDNDEIVQILGKTSSKLQDYYGDFYISEIIGSQPESNRRIIVAECQDKVVGVIGINSDVNYNKLQNIYELRPFYGLRKATPLEKELNKRNNVLLNTFGDPIMRGQWSPFDLPSKAHFVDTKSEKQSQHKREVKKKPSKVNFQCTPSEQDMDHIILYTSEDYSERISIYSGMSVLTNFSVEQLLDDDAFDYEIVNIDKNLLTIPEGIPSDLVLRDTELQESFANKMNTDKMRPKRRQSTSGTALLMESDPYIYRGEPNAFVIELFGIRDDFDGECEFQLLEASFDMLKVFDYCIIRVPAADKSFSLLQHFCFVPTKAKFCCEYALYIAHKSSVFGKLRVRQAEFMDIPKISNLLQKSEGKETLWTIENSILENKDHKVYVFMSGLSLIGIGVLQSPEQLNFLRVKFNMDIYHNHIYHLPGQSVDSGFASIKFVLLYPVFEPHFRYFARELMRLSGSCSLVWLTGYRSKWVLRKTNSIASAMVPLIPRKILLNFSIIPELRHLDSIERQVTAFSAWFLDKKLTSLPMRTISTRIVVVGASRTAISFLNSLLFHNSSTYLLFTNVTLISRDGLPYARKSHPAAHLMFPQNHHSSDKCLKSIPYTYYVNVVQGTMAGINKTERFIELTNRKRYYYDMLFLLYGKQYQHPNYMETLLKQDREYNRHNNPSYVRMDVPRPYIILPTSVPSTPDNVFIVNTIADANKALKYVSLRIAFDSSSNIIVYGATIDAYCCLAALLEAKVPPKNIIFVEPFPPEDPFKTRVSVFCNENVDETVNKVIEGLQIRTYRSYYFKSWTVYNNNVIFVEFLSHFHLLKLECSVLFYYGKRGVDIRAFYAVNNCGMAYNAGILIDHNFRTNDPYIYAAGSATAYHSRYYAADKKQKYYDPYEFGYKLGQQIRNQLDPLFKEKEYMFDRRRSSVRFSKRSSIWDDKMSKNSTGSYDDQKNLREHLPKFVKPKVINCKLPGGLKYLEVRSPGKKVPHYYLQSLGYNGIVMETFKKGYFKIHLTKDLIVDSITCLTPEDYSLENFKNIYGLPSVVLNNVHIRYTTKKLDDFYEFFRSSWAFFLFHDQFDELYAMVKELLPKGQNSGDTMSEALRKIPIGSVEKYKSPYDIITELRKNVDASPHVDAVYDYVMSWLSHNEAIMPMYLQPSQRIIFTHDLQRNVCFKKKKKIVELILKLF